MGLFIEETAFSARQAPLPSSQQGMSSLAVIDEIPSSSCAHRWSPEDINEFSHRPDTLSFINVPWGFVKRGNRLCLWPQLLAYRSGWLCSPLSWRSIWSKYGVSLGVGLERQESVVIILLLQLSFYLFIYLFCFLKKKFGPIRRFRD